MTETDVLSPSVLRVDPGALVKRLVTDLRVVVHRRLLRKGAVVGLSGGVDSSVVAALCVRAFGPRRVFGLFTPEADSAPDTLDLSRLVADQLGIPSALHDITPTLEAVGCYRLRDEAIRAVIPEFSSGWKFKIVLPSLLDTAGFRLFSLVVEAPGGDRIRKRLSAESYLQLVAATNFKQRARKMIEYYHADRLGFAVMGTANRLELDQGFFVKNGDGAADVKPIAHLYKSQVYQLAEYLGLPDQICAREPTTDTYSLSQSQEEFFFSVPYQVLDLCLYAKDHGIASEAVALALNLSPSEVGRVFDDIDRKRRVAHYLGLPPQLLDDFSADLGA